MGARILSVYSVLFLIITFFSGCSGNVFDASSQKSGKSSNSVHVTDTNVLSTTTNSSAVFEPLSVESYALKVKNILTSMPLTDDEMDDIQANPNNIRNYISTWSQSPQALSKWQDFFAHAFQQNMVVDGDFVDQTFFDGTGTGLNYFGANSKLLLQNLQESFARTAVQLILQQNQPLTSLINTNSLMMTVPMMMYYAELDEQIINDNQKANDVFDSTSGNALSYTMQSYKTVNISSSLNPNDPNYMIWNTPALALHVNVSNSNIVAPSNPNTFTIYKLTARATTYPDYENMVMPGLMRFLFGGGFDCLVRNPNNNIVGYYTSKCGASTPCDTSYISPQDFNNWNMITIRQPNTGESITRFYDLTTLRSTNTLVLKIPRIGFFSTPAFFAGYQTNTSNQARVLMNQTMIVALGQAFDGTDTTVPANTNALDTTHVNEGVCAQCHDRLDPMRQYFRQAYSLHGHQQTDPNQISIPSAFAFFESPSTAGNGLMDMAQKIINHPLFASAWVQKLCTYANSAPCDTTDPEFQRILQVFQQSNYSWNTLVQELFSSPLVTYAAATQSTVSEIPVISISRQGHFCTALSNRLGISDICGLKVTTQEPNSLSQVPTIAQALPSDSYSRGNVNPVLVSSPGMILFSGLENICLKMAVQVVDPTSMVTGQVTFSSHDQNAIANIVATVMGLNQSRSAPAIDLLTDHYSKVLAISGMTATQALQSTFIVACLSPSSVAIGF